MNKFDHLIIDDVEYKTDHLLDLSLVIDVIFENGDTRAITVHIRPTNHLISRKVTDIDFTMRADIEAQGRWLKSYVHYEGKYQMVIPPQKIKEHRIFCENKWQDSFLFPDFIDLITKNPSLVTVLANSGDEKTCLSGILTIENQPDKAYLVFFKLTKVNSKEANMLIESAYCVDPQKDKKCQKLLSPRQHNAKTFILILKNVMEGRKPMESKKYKVQSGRRRNKIKR